MECHEYEWLGCIPLCSDIEITGVEEADSYTIYINGKVKLIQDNLTIDGQYFEEGAINSIVIKIEGEVVKRIKFKTIVEIKTLCEDDEECTYDYVDITYVDCSYLI